MKNPLFCHSRPRESGENGNPVPLFCHSRPRETCPRESGENGNPVFPSVI